MIVERIGWDESLCDAFKISVGRDGPLIFDQARKGQLDVWCCSDSKTGKHAHVLTRDEPPYFVVVCFEGRGLAHFMPLCREVARSKGLTIRAHATSEHVAKILKGVGFVTTEWIMDEGA